VALRKSLAPAPGLGIKTCPWPWPWRAVAFALCICLFCGSAQAENPAAGSPLHDPLPDALATPYSIAPIDPRLYKFKKALLDLGYNFQVNYTGEMIGNPVGGAQQSAIYEGLLELGIDGDLDRIAGLKGASFHINAFQMHGHGLSTYNLYNYSTISGIEGRPTTRLFEAWFEQEVFDGTASIRVGQLAADTEFLASDFDALYWNGTFGWPNLTSYDLPGGGPHYPLTTPGIRLKLMPNETTTFLIAVFNGDPAGAGLDISLSEVKNCCGINFRLKDPPFFIAQADFEYALPLTSDGLAGKLRIGGWQQFGAINDKFYASDGRVLTDPASNGDPIVHYGNQSTYAILDQMLWHRPGQNAWRGIGAFIMAIAAPADRNLISLEVQAGVNFMGVWDARPDDIFGAAFSYTRISPYVGALQRAEAASLGNVPAQSYEIALEATYQAQIVQGFFVQPEFQYIFRPGAGLINPINPSAGQIPDATVFGLRTVVKF
jgi:porin